MTTPVTTCPWWCTDHRTGATAEDEQHARTFPVPGGAWVVILLGALPADRPELAYAAESYARSPDQGRAFAAALRDAADLFEQVLAEWHRRDGSAGGDGVSACRTP
ncbi:hypothetical protein GL325_14485 [Aeromicrobium sp. 636]|uniref:Uncharacterized protein n=1 Tax=Aeromicrobium senzhongii TaxID=2663859 RepID=A0A8I0EWI4_9ACTN|nr:MULTISPECIES: hypothetical protein [Aeromicrobium]MBC9227534.1 hypothetical protein [Aeromicrobium senzhongii]MCQ3999631.1 hypothetical protein [Aeromicrobium sp. 636]